MIALKDPDYTESHTNANGGERMPDLTGRTIRNRYRVKEFIGRGGMAYVYQVRDQVRTAHLAMKVLHADLAEDRIFLLRWLVIRGGLVLMVLWI